MLFRSDFQIGLQDFLNTSQENEIGSYYYGVVMESGVGYNVKHIKTATTNIANGGASLVLSLSEAPFDAPLLAPVRLYHLLVSEAVPNVELLNSVSQKHYLSLPNDADNITMLDVKEAGLGLTLNAVEVSTSPSANMFPIEDYQTMTEAGGQPFLTNGALYFKIE